MMKAILLGLVVASSIACGSAQNDQTSNVNLATPRPERPSGEAGKPPSPTPSPSPSEESNKVVQVRFPAGATEASYTDSFAAYGYVDFAFDAKADQNLTAEITTSDGDKAILTVMRNGTAVENDAAMVQGWTGILPDTGRYVIRVGQMRNEARRGDSAVKFFLTIRIVD